MITFHKNIFLNNKGYKFSSRKRMFLSRFLVSDGNHSVEKIFVSLRPFYEHFFAL